MKKISILTVAVLSFLFSSLNAQITKGSLFLGGNFSAGSQKIKNSNAGTTNYSYSSFTITPVVGKVIRENLVLGADAGYSFYKNEMYNAVSKLKQHSYSAGIFLRQYRPLGKGFYIFLQERLGYRYEDSKNTYNNVSENDFKRNSININVNPGLSYAINKKFHMEAGFNNLVYLNYSGEKGNNYNGNSSGPYKSNSFNAGVDLNGYSSLYVGFRILLSK